jgi:hypothetical protein
MAPNFQSSFIPKEPVTEEVFKKKKAGPIGVLVVSVFIFSIIVAIGLYAYKGIVKNDIQNLQLQLAEAEKNVDKKTIGEMSKFGKKLDLVRTIVAKHQAVSNFLDSLASSTVSTVQFTDFSYGNLEAGKLVVTMRGKATSYAVVALQEKVFSQNKYFKSVSFSNLTLADKGMVSFDLAISVDPQVSIYTP